MLPQMMVIDPRAAFILANGHLSSRTGVLTGGVLAKRRCRW
jgi:hypothetical protein